MSLTMYLLVLVPACMSSLGRGRRIQALGVEYASSPSDERELTSLQALATLLEQARPTAAAFNPAHLGAPYLAQQHVPVNIQMGGFGGAAKPPPKKGGKKTKAAAAPNLEAKPRKQWTRYLDMKKSGSATYLVSVRAAGEAEWTKVGFVSCADGTSPEAAIQAQKKLIFQHAARLKPTYGVGRGTLDIGYSKDDEEPVVSKRSEPADLKLCGLEGLEDPTGFYYPPKDLYNRWTSKD